jgi:serine/threonine protein kinase
MVRADHVIIVRAMSLLPLCSLSLADGSFKNQMTVKRQLRVASGITAGLAFLHANDVAHRDLKSSNVLYDRDLHVKLCDFAFSKFKEGLSAKMESRVGYS